MTETNKKVFSVLKISVTVILIAVVIIIAASLAVAKVKNKPLPTVCGFGACVVISGSMEPTLSVDDLIVVKTTDNLKIGDIILYKHDGSLVVHRMTFISDDKQTIITKGDANKVSDTPINCSAVVGKVVATVPRFGKLLNFLRSPFGILTVAFLVLIALLVKFIFKNLLQTK